MIIRGKPPRRAPDKVPSENRTGHGAAPAPGPDTPRLNEVFNNLINVMDIALWELDRSYRIVASNRKALEIYGNDAVGQFCHRLAANLESPCPGCPVKKVFDGAPSGRSEHIRTDVHGRRIVIDHMATPIRARTGQITGALVLIIDITRRKEMEADIRRHRDRLEEQLRVHQRMDAIGNLAGGIAHDFNNLLMGIMGNVSLVLSELDRNHRYHKHLENIEALAMSGSRLTDQLLGYARISPGGARVVDLNPIVQQTAETFIRTRKDLVIRLDLCPRPAVAEVGRHQIEQVLLNLCGNAADAMPRGGRMVLSTSIVPHTRIPRESELPDVGDYAMLRVADTGTGMDAETRKRIFDPFFTTKEMGRGTGLGLSSALSIITACNGYVRVQSEAGKGSIFTVYLKASTRKVPGPDRHGSVLKKGKGMVLVVDDEEPVLEVAGAMLRKIGYDVIEAGSCRQAQLLLKEHRRKVDVVLLDLVMPGGDSGETCSELKTIQPEVKILLSSGYSSESRVAETVRRSCDGFIQKPYNMAALSKKISELMGSG